MHQLKRDYFFEFAGMPKAGKSTIEDSIAHFLKREGFPIQEYDGGSKYSVLADSDIGFLNLELACKTVKFANRAVASRTNAYKIYLLERGLVDRFIFTDALLREGNLDEDEARRIYDILTLPRLFKRMDGVFIFITTPEMALERGSINKLVRSTGGVMNEKFLTTLRSATLDGCKYAKEHIPNILLFDTEKEDGKVHKVAGRVRDNILAML